MYAPHVSFARLRLPEFARMAVFVLPVLVVALGVGWWTHWSSDAPIAGTVVAIGTGLVGVELLRQAWRTDREWTSAQCRSAGFFGFGMIAVCGTGLAMAINLGLGHTEVATSYLVATGLLIASLSFVGALLVMPGATNGLVAHLRRGLDGASVGICLLFTTWVLVIAPKGRIRSLGFWIAVVACCVVAIAVVTALRPTLSRRPIMLYSAGVVTTTLALIGLAIALQNRCQPGWSSFFSVPLLGGAGLIWLGARRTSAAGEPSVVDPAAALAGYPLLTAPAAVAIVVALHRIVVGARFDRPSAVLGITGIAVVALREAFAARDVARYARRIVAQEAQFRSLVAGSSDVIMVLDSELVVRWQSTAAARLFGLSDQEVVGRHYKSMVHPEDAVMIADRLADVRAGYVSTGESPAIVEARLRDGFGRWRETESTISDQRDVPEVAGLVVHIRDVSERKEMERTLHRLAYADQLTGLANRRQMLQSIVAQKCLPRPHGALLLIELDGFNAVNDVRGYDIGDAVLVEVASRLRGGAGPSDLPARLSGDEFAMVTEANPVQAYALATRLVTMLAEPITLPGVTVHLSASVGIAELAGATNGDDVLRRADLALRRAKHLGRGRVEWFDEVVEEAIMRRMTIEQELPEALVRGELDLIYQPIVDLVVGRPYAVEALLRWRHPRLGTLMPLDIIPAAEDIGQITEIGGWVLHQASRQLATWLREGRDLSMAVNVSPRQLAGNELATDVETVLRLHQFPAERLVLEVAEGGLTEDAAAVDERVSQVRSLGVRTALDEFGTGPESLSHLRRLPIDMVKIGRSFFDDPAAKPGQSVPIIDVMVGLGRRLGIDIVAQGLEAPAHLEVVRAAGCRLGQGHLFARAQPAERTEAYLDGFRLPAG